MHYETYEYVVRVPNRPDQKISSDANPEVRENGDLVFFVGQRYEVRHAFACGHWCSFSLMKRPTTEMVDLYYSDHGAVYIEGGVPDANSPRRDEYIAFLDQEIQDSLSKTSYYTPTNYKDWLAKADGGAAARGE